MFKVGDHVVVTNNENMNGVFSVGDKFIITGVVDEDTYQTVVLSNKNYWRYSAKYFKLDDVYYRKEKY